MTTLAVVGAVAGTVVVPTAAGAAVDPSAHSYSFDHTLVDSAGGVDAVVHGGVSFTVGRLDPPDTADAALRLDGRPEDYVSIANPVLDYGTTDFTLDLWFSTTATWTETILDTGRCALHRDGFALVLSGGGQLSLLLSGAERPTGPDTGTPHDDTTGTAPDASRERGGPGASTHGVAAGGDAIISDGRNGARGRTPAGVPSAPRANDGHWHEATLTRAGSTFVVRLDGTVDETLTRPALTDLDSDVGVRLGRGWCDDERGFTGELDDVTATPVPPAALPETPLVAVLPVSAAAVGAVAVALARRRRSQSGGETRPTEPRGR